MPRYRFNEGLRPGQHIMLIPAKGEDARHSVQLDPNMCVSITAEQAQLFSDAGWNLEPYDPIKHAHPFADSGLPKSANEVLEQIKFEDPEARDFARQAIMLEAARRLNADATTAQSIAEHDEQVATQKQLAESAVGTHERKAQDAAEAPHKRR
ncbi:MAG: hypothetical protein ACR2KS_10170 [Candidatus Eremiobacter antarcticus]|nr:hypothetical protein [Candidatus Eremiobacteraeota bacterium]MBC5808798.1 hypothetical protein [Candidatus Eremiobacteraeota bacterium]